ncbi:MAG: sulfotransferase [Pegethrix bostrychoides GSE-TBD4-15B]|jgi:hypothetical protein|uniref:Sulfotransferase n=1 Tax=Pegethrix bostrychoides GSE-TBD4-15B TaxID=2839662 RepID=A0A951PE02_9CYAN|nr:sulfotransferase [Pegethrix bostrychoides GSE-TBD4-15B]
MLDFLVIGSQKCGTTWLFDRLKMHPQLYFPVGKEGNHWNHQFYQGKLHQSLYYAAMHGSVVELGQYLCGEITPEYAVMSLEQIQTLQKHYPNVQIFLMVRNPIERAWSAIKMTYRYHQLNLADLNDEQAILAITSGRTAALGQYDQILQTWLSVFDSSQLHLLFFDDLPLNYRDLLSQVCSAVGADDSFFAQIPDALLSRPSLAGAPTLLSTQVYDACLSFYQPSIRFLEAYSQRCLNAWSEPRQVAAALHSL